MTTWELSHLLEEQGWSVHNLPSTVVPPNQTSLHEEPVEYDLQGDPDATDESPSATWLRRSTLLKLLSERRQDIIPVTTYGVDRYSHPWMAADPSFARLLEATDAHEHIFALHRSYYASFGATDVLAVSDPAAVEQRSYRVEEATHTEYVLHTPLGELTAHYTENDGVHTVWRHDLLIKTDDDMDRFSRRRLCRPCRTWLRSSGRGSAGRAWGDGDRDARSPVSRRRKHVVRGLHGAHGLHA